MAAVPREAPWARIAAIGHLRVCTGCGDAHKWRTMGRGCCARPTRVRAKQARYASARGQRCIQAVACSWRCWPRWRAAMPGPTMTFGRARPCSTSPGGPKQELAAKGVDLGIDLTDFMQALQNDGTRLGQRWQVRPALQPRRPEARHLGRLLRLRPHRIQLRQQRQPGRAGAEHHPDQHRAGLSVAERRACSRCCSRRPSARRPR